MRYQGKITEWNADRGFGFITWNGGGDRIFLHVSAFTRKVSTPTVGLVVTYELGADGRNRPRAMKVEIAGRSATPATAPQAGPSGDEVITPVVAVVFLMGVVAAMAMGALPWILLLWFLGLSALSFLMYGWDKVSALNRRSRVAEKTLHVIDLAGGWPGAAFGQRRFRHKTRKASFRLAFWGTVCLNMAATIGLAMSGAAVSLFQALALS